MAETSGMLFLQTMSSHPKAPFPLKGKGPNDDDDVESSTFTLVYKIHFDANRPLFYEEGMPCEQSSPQFVFQYFSNPIT